MAATRLPRRSLLGLCGAGVLLGLAGCANAPRPAPPAGAAPVHTRSVWRGRLGLQVLAADGTLEQSLSASFELQGSPQQGRLDVFNPLGTQVARLRWQPQAAWLEQGQQVLESPSLPALVQRSLGADIPLDALFAWLQGQAVQVAGWQVDLARYAQGRIQAQRHSPLPLVHLRVVLEPQDG